MAQGLSILNGVHPELQRRMLSAIAATEARGVPLIVRSGYRTQTDQQRLWDARGSNPYPVAPVGFSPHEWGVATDVRPITQTAAHWQVLWQEAARVGLTLGHNFQKKDDVHFELPGFTHGGSGNTSQPGLAQYGVYRKPAYAGDFNQSARGPQPGGNAPAVPGGGALPPSGFDVNTFILIAIAGLALLALRNWNEG